MYKVVRILDLLFQTLFDSRPYFITLFLFLNAILNIIFRVKGIKSKSPIKSEKKPGIINNKAARAIEAPDNNS